MNSLNIPNCGVFYLPQTTWCLSVSEILLTFLVEKTCRHKIICIDWQLSNILMCWLLFITCWYMFLPCEVTSSTLAKCYPWDRTFWKGQVIAVLSRYYEIPIDGWLSIASCGLNILDWNNYMHWCMLMHCSTFNQISIFTWWKGTKSNWKCYVSSSIVYTTLGIQTHSSHGSNDHLLNWTTGPLALEVSK